VVHTVPNSCPAEGLLEQPTWSRTIFECIEKCCCTVLTFAIVQMLTTYLYSRDAYFLTLLSGYTKLGVSILVVTDLGCTRPAEKEHIVQLSRGFQSDANTGV